MVPSPSRSKPQWERHTKKLVEIPSLSYSLSHCCSLLFSILSSSPSLTLFLSLLSLPRSLSLRLFLPCCIPQSSSYYSGNYHKQSLSIPRLFYCKHAWPAHCLPDRLTVNPTRKAKTHKPNKGTSKNKTPWQQIISLLCTHSMTIIPELHMCNLATRLYVYARIIRLGKMGETCIHT